MRACGKTRRAGRRFLRLLFLLLAALALAAGNIARGEEAVPAINSSGNQNIAPAVDIFSDSQGYSAVLYDSRGGLPVSETEAVAQTKEGFLWIASYAGLIRYDGVSFERIDPASGGVPNALALYVDSRDLLWIATNDAGVAVMENGSFRSFGEEDGLPFSSVRAIAEDGNGVIYIAGTGGIVTVDPDMRLEALADPRLEKIYIRDIRSGGDGLIYGLTQDGDLFSLRDGVVETFLSEADCRVKGIIGLLPDPARPGCLYLGTESSVVYYGDLKSNFAELDTRDIAPLSYVERFEYIDGQIWICAGNGIGCMDETGFRWLDNVPMDNSVSHVMTDFEGNLWFTSNRQGLMKLTPSQFYDVFEHCDLPGAVVNGTCLLGSRLFVATDSGLIVLEDGTRLDSLPLTRAVTASGEDLGAGDLVEYLEGVRIRSIIRDSRNRLWIATWRKYGLLCYDRGLLTAYTIDDGLFSDRVRVAQELADGTIAVISAGGVNLIAGGSVTAGFDEEAGIENTEILTLAEGGNGDLVLGSDGDGLYILHEGRARHINREDGLMSDVILRVKYDPGRDLFWIVCSNSLAIMTSDYQITAIKNFPYSNNFDLFENDRGEIWVLSSSGIYMAAAEELIENGGIHSLFLGRNQGLPCTATANSYSELTEDGDLYMAGSVGVVKFNINAPLRDTGSIRGLLPYIDADGERLFPDSDGGYTIPSGVLRLTLYPYVISYSLIDPEVSCRLEGFDAESVTVLRSELMPLTYTNLPNGSYQFIIQVSDALGRSSESVSFRITKGRALSSANNGSLFLDFFSLLLILILLTHTTLYRRRARPGDRLFFAMLLVNLVLTAVDALSHLLEGSVAAGVREAMLGGGILFCVGAEVLLFLCALYPGFCANGEKPPSRDSVLLTALPAFVLVVFLLNNPFSGWIFSVGEDNMYVSGPYNWLAFLPAAFYLPLALLRLRRTDVRLTIIAALLIALRAAAGIWLREISSTAFTFTLFLACTHIRVMNRPLMEDTK